VTTAAEALGQALGCYQAGLYAEAEQAAREAVAPEPGHAEVWCWIGLACRAQGKNAEAETCYREAVRLPQQGAGRETGNS
jgi:Flp pilus assembly protein TadD